MTEKTKRKETPQTFQQKYGMLIVAGVCLLLLSCMVAQQIFVDNALFDEYYPGLYLFESEIITIIFNIFVVSVCFGSPFFIIIALLMTLKKIYKHRTWQNLATLLTLIACGVMLYMVIGTGMFSDSVKVHHRAIINGRTYYVAALHTYDNLGFAPYAIYECDDAEFRCMLVFTDIPGTHQSNHIHITSDDKQIMVEITYNGNSEVYTYRPD